MRVKLGELGKIITGNTPKTSETENYNSNDICFIKPSDISENDITYIYKSEFYLSEIARDKARILPQNSLLVTCIGIIGKVAINKVECAFNQQINAIIPNVNKCLPNYLAYTIQYKKDEIQKIANTAVVPILNKTQFSNIEVFIPRVEEQQKIAAVLDKVSDLIALRKKQLEKLEELVKACFVEMFGDLRLNKKNWETGVLSNYYSIKGGKRIPKGMGYSKNITSHPYLRTTDMKNATILDDDIRYIDDNVFEHIKNYTVKKGDIYLTNVGVNLGMAGIIPDKYDGANLTENAVKFVPKKQKVHNALFLVYYINSYEIQNYINERKMSVGVPKLAIFRIETIPIKLPPLKLQEQFADFVTKVDKQKLTIQQSLAKLEVLKKALMQQYFG